MRSLFLGACVLAVGSLLGNATAQDAHPALTRNHAATTPFALNEIAVLQDLDGYLVGAGRDYKVYFEDDGIQFVPMLGGAAPRNLPVRFSLASIGRRNGETLTAAKLGAPTREATGLRVDYSRGLVIERYDVLVTGVEQSFVFDSIPEGSGDLIVRIALDTELDPSGDGKVLDLGSEYGGVHIGAVTGIDARGARAEGSVRFVDGHLELGLPASFVDSAAPPLVLDPLIGSTITVASTNDEQDPDCAYDQSFNRYAVVWERIFSSSDYDIALQRVSSAGSLTGSAVLVESDGNVLAYNPAIANVNSVDRFVVVWEQQKISGMTIQNDIYARSIPSTINATPTPGPIRSVLVNSDWLLQPDVAGDSSTSTSHNAALCVFTDLTNQEILGRRLVVDNTTGAITLGALVNLQSTVYQDSYASISKSGGAPGRYLVVWQRQFTGYATTRAAVFDRNLSSLTGFITLNQGPTVAPETTDRRTPTCDGDGSQWVVAYTIDESADPSLQDVACRSVHLAASTALVGDEQYVSGASNVGDDEGNPEVGWLGDSAIIAHADQRTGANYDAYVASVSLFNCTPCEGRPALQISATLDADFFGIATKFSGDVNARDEALIVWESNDTAASNTGSVLGFRWDASDGTVQDLGGGCAGGGEMFASCARTPKSDFEFRLERAAIGTAFVVISPDRIDIACGPCTLVPDPFVAIAVSAGATASGAAKLTVAIPSDTALDGARLYTQWLLVHASPACSAIGADMSNALEITIEP